MIQTDASIFSCLIPKNYVPQIISADEWNSQVSSLLGRDSSYPKYDVFKEDSGYGIQIAAAGFKKDEFYVEIANNLLTRNIEILNLLKQ